MIGTHNDALQFQIDALNLRAHRQQLLASNIANADTPNYKAVDIDFAKALQNARSSFGTLPLATSSPLHLNPNPSDITSFVKSQYRQVLQPSLDGNTVDTDLEMAQFSDNAIHYQADLIFLREHFREMMGAVQGQ